MHSWIPSRVAQIRRRQLTRSSPATISRPTRKTRSRSYVPKLRRIVQRFRVQRRPPGSIHESGIELDHSDDRNTRVLLACSPGRTWQRFLDSASNQPRTTRSLWADLFDGYVTVGEFRLQEHRTNWVLPRYVEYAVPEPDQPDDPTPIGFDIGESKLLTDGACQEGTPTQPMPFDGKRARHLRKEMFTTLRRFQQRNADWRVDERFDHYQNALTDIVEKASRQAVDYAEGFENPVIVSKTSRTFVSTLDYGKCMNRRLHNWAFARLTGRIEDKARDTGIPVRIRESGVHVSTCHACGHIGSRVRKPCSAVRTATVGLRSTKQTSTRRPTSPVASTRGERSALKPHTDERHRMGVLVTAPQDTATPSPKSGQTTLCGVSVLKPPRRGFPCRKPRPLGRARMSLLSAVPLCVPKKNQRDLLPVIAQRNRHISSVWMNTDTAFDVIETVVGLVRLLPARLPSFG